MFLSSVFVYADVILDVIFGHICPLNFVMPISLSIRQSRVLVRTSQQLHAADLIAEINNLNVKVFTGISVNV